MKAAVILAAGRGTRMKSERAKVLQTLGGRSLVRWVLAAVSPLVERCIVVVGHDREAVREELSKDSVVTAVQEPQLGTGHAVGCAIPELVGVTTFLVLAGDAPLVSSEALTSLLDEHEARAAMATVMTFEAADPAGYGRIVRDVDGTVLRIVEHVDASAPELAIRECNSGTFVFQAEAVLPLLAQLPRSAKGEYYLTDVVAMLRDKGQTVAACRVDESDAQGVNTLEQLSALESDWRQRRLAALQAAGVTILSPESVHVEAGVQVAAGVSLGPEVWLEGTTSIAAGCLLRDGVRLRDVGVGEDCTLIGPFERSDTSLPAGTRAG